MKVKFVVLGEPQGKGRPRFSKVGNHVQTRTPDETLVYIDNDDINVYRRDAPDGDGPEHRLLRDLDYSAASMGRSQRFPGGPMRVPEVSSPSGVITGTTKAVRWSGSRNIRRGPGSVRERPTN